MALNFELSSCNRPAFLSSFSRLQVIQNKRPWWSAAAYVTAGLPFCIAIDALYKFWALACFLSSDDGVTFSMYLLSSSFSLVSFYCAMYVLCTANKNFFSYELKRIVVFIHHL